MDGKTAKTKKKAFLLPGNNEKKNIQHQVNNESKKKKYIDTYSLLKLDRTFCILIYLLF